MIIMYDYDYDCNYTGLNLFDYDYDYRKNIIDYDYNHNLPQAWFQKKGLNYPSYYKLEENCKKFYVILKLNLYWLVMFVGVCAFSDILLYSTYHLHWFISVFKILIL